MNKIIFLAFFILPVQLFSQEKTEPISPCVSEFYLPNSFSGNGDSINDTYLPRLVGTPDKYEFMIFNRWGEVIFKTEKVSEGWNGRFNDVPVSSGVYVWKIQFTCAGSDEKYQYMGNVSLIR